MENNIEEYALADGPKYKFTIGSTSLLLLSLIGVIFTILMVWSSQYQGMDRTGPAIMAWIIMVFTGFPLLIASIVTGIIAIMKSKGRTEGIVALSVTVPLALWVVTTLLSL
jgi:hypothetical protein